MRNLKKKAMFKIINQNESHDFYYEPEGPLFNIVSKGEPCGFGGYKSCVMVMKKFGYNANWSREIAAREKFMGVKK
jgi:hypothetical protein